MKWDAYTFHKKTGDFAQFFDGLATCLAAVDRYKDSVLSSDSHVKQLAVKKHSQASISHWAKTLRGSYPARSKAFINFFSSFQTHARPCHSVRLNYRAPWISVVQCWRSR